MKLIKTKQFIIFLIGLLIIGGGVLGRKRQELRKDRSTYNYAVKVSHVKTYKPFVVVICSYNNSEYAEENLMSALAQVYPNYRIIFIDDASTDNTFEIVSNLVHKHSAQDRVTLIKNNANQGAMANTYRAVHLCRNEEIVVMLDGDDRLLHPNVLQELNHYYNNSAIWLTYGQCVEKKSGKLGLSMPISNFILKSGRIKKKAWMTSHLRTFYAGLFKRIKLKDLTYQGRFLPMAPDVAAMLPMIEMAREHACYISEPLYEYNLENPINEHKKSAKTQSFFDQYVRNLPVYKRLNTPPWEQSAIKSTLSDVMVFSLDRPLQLYAFLESLEQYGRNVGNTFVIYRASNAQYAAGYDRVKQRFPKAVFIKEHEKKSKAQKQFKSLVMKYGFHPNISQNAYITFAVDDLILKDEVDFATGIQYLEQTGAHAFVYRLGKNITTTYMTHSQSPPPPLMALGHDVYAWLYEEGEGDWKYPNTVDFALYRKQDIQPELEQIQFTFPPNLEGIWASRANCNRIALCHGTSRIVNMPLNLVSQSTNRHAQVEYPTSLLLEKFNQGLKMDLRPLEKYDNHGCHMDYIPTFVMRDDE